MEEIYIVSSTQSAGTDADVWAFKNINDARQFMEELTGQEQKDWTDDDSTVYEDSMYIENIAWIKAVTIR